MAMSEKSSATSSSVRGVGGVVAAHEVGGRGQRVWLVQDGVGGGDGQFANRGGVQRVAKVEDAADCWLAVRML
jgi:hypothetical protein